MTSKRKFDEFKTSVKTEYERAVADLYECIRKVARHLPLPKTPISYAKYLQGMQFISEEQKSAINYHFAGPINYFFWTLFQKPEYESITPLLQAYFTIELSKELSPEKVNALLLDPNKGAIPFFYHQNRMKINFDNKYAERILQEVYKLKEEKKENTWQGLFGSIAKKYLIFTDVMSVSELIDLIESRYIEVDKAISALQEEHTDVNLEDSAKVLAWCQTQRPTGIRRISLVPEHLSLSENEKRCALITSWFATPCLQDYTPEKTQHPESPFFKHFADELFSSKSIKREEE